MTSTRLRVRPHLCPIPTSEQTAVAPLIGAVPAEEAELVSTDYADEYGNRITIRRPA